MLLTICTGKKRNGVTDHYKITINEFSEKNKIIAVVPVVYKRQEFSGDFHDVIVEKFSDKNKIMAVYAGIIFAIQLRKIVRKYHIKKVFLYFDNDWFNIIIKFFFWNLKVKYYVWMHDPLLHSGEGYINKTVRRFNTFFLYKKAERIFISYNGMKEFVSSSFNVDESKVVSVKLPRMTELEYDELRVREETLNEYKYDVIFFGRIEEYKGIDLFIESIDYIESEYGIVLKALIAGTGNFEESIQQMIKGKNNYTFINRYVASYELAEYIINSKIVIMPYRDATGTSTIQVANYYNKPVIASRVGCFPEYITNGVNGFLMDYYAKEDLAKKIFELMNNEALYKEMRNRIPGFFNENFNTSIIVKSIEQELSI